MHGQWDSNGLDELVAEAQAGDREALALLWERALPVTRARVWRSLDHLRGSDVAFYDADDLMQDLYLDFHLWLASISPGSPYDALQQWAYRLPLALKGILRRPPLRLGRFRREQALEVPGEDDSDEADNLPGCAPDPADFALRKEQTERVQEAMRTLPRCHRRLLWMRYGQEASVQEMASRLGWPPARVYQGLRAARERLWQALSV
ncbi:MAG: RNA polymerase sigma factor [Anaerolineae bacterium]